jgi:hypothetical protein
MAKIAIGLFPLPVAAQPLAFFGDIGGAPYSFRSIVTAASCPVGASTSAKPGNSLTDLVVNRKAQTCKAVR